MSLLFEKSGIIEFDNDEYKKRITEISHEIMHLSGPIEYLPFLKEYTKKPFIKFSYDDLHLTRLNSLDIYVQKSDDLFDAGAMAGNGFGKYTYYSDDGVIEKGSVYVIGNASCDWTMILMHEIKHLYDYLYYKNINFNDSDHYKKYYAATNYDITKYTISTTINEIDEEAVHLIIIESMNYSNYSERHAILENIRYEIENSLKNPQSALYHYGKHVQFMYSSSMLLDIYTLYVLIGKILKKDTDFKKRCYDNHSEIYRQIYKHYHNLDQMLHLYEQKFKKILSHSKRIFEYYYGTSPLNRNRTGKV